MYLDEKPLRNGNRPERIQRPRLASLLARAAIAPITVIVAPAGSGKSDIVRESLVGANVIYFRAGKEGRTFARFVYGLAHAVGSVAPGAAASFPRAWERSLHSRSPASALALWLCGHLEGFDRNIVVDDLHDAAANPSIASFIASIAESRTNVRLTITARSVGALPIALWMATGRVHGGPINACDLAFNRAEIAEAAAQAGVNLKSTTISELLVATSGLPIAVAYVLARFRHDPSRNVSIVPASFQGIAEDVFGRRTEREQNFLLQAALLPRIEDDVLRLLGWDDPERIRTAMGGDAAFMWTRDDAGCLGFDDRFRDYLEQEFRSRDIDLRSTIARRAVRALTSTGRHAAALEAATRQLLIETIGEVLDSHGFEILESGEIDIISEALAAVEKSSLGAIGLALRGYMQASSGQLDTAEAWFRLGMSAAEDETVRATIAIYYARELTKRRREDACDLLQEFAASTTLPRPILIDVRSSFARALAAANRLDEARSNIDDAVGLLDSDSPPALRARVFERASFVALVSGRPEIAREYALIAVPLAVANSLYEVAGSAYGTLYNIAYDIDDDPVSTLEYVRRHRDMGVKSGILRADLFGMLALYELYAEAGDDAALRDMNDQIAALDTHDAGIYLMETMIPAKALQAGWVGNFVNAQRLLRPTAERQATPARRALCWAQVRLHCAATGDAKRAEQALQGAQRALDQLEQHELRTTQYGLTLLYLALASLVGNDIEDARRWTNSAGDAVIGHARRLRALRAAIEALIACVDDPNRFAQGVPVALAALRTQSFGGMAKLIEALPYPFSIQGKAKTTVGSTLSGLELSARFAAAVAAEDTALLRAWLDTAHGSTFRHTSVTAQFEQWASKPDGSHDRKQFAIGNIRRDLATYHRPARDIVETIDEIDVALEALFEELDVVSPLMAEHSRAVSAWCTRLGRTIGLSESETTFVGRCGLIHDIGKMWTPREILDAPRQLTASEWVVMRAHTTEGAGIVARLPILSAFVPIVRSHHERLDGKGYPDGLTSEEIPLAARIVAVADCFNAMIGRRPYRPAMAPTEALNELERHRGTQFDPEIVEAMLQIVLGRRGEPASV